MKIITYKVMGYTGVYNPETKEVEQHESVATAIAECRTQSEYDKVYATVEKEAIPGTIGVSGEFEPEPVPAGEPVTWEDLNNAYQEGVDSV